jgi:hypothetical protein
VKLKQLEFVVKLRYKLDAIAPLFKQILNKEHIAMHESEGCGR